MNLYMVSDVLGFHTAWQLGSKGEPGRSCIDFSGLASTVTQHHCRPILPSKAVTKACSRSRVGKWALLPDGRVTRVRKSMWEQNIAVAVFFRKCNLLQDPFKYLKSTLSSTILPKLSLVFLVRPGVQTSLVLPLGCTSLNVV